MKTRSKVNSQRSNVSLAPITRGRVYFCLVALTVCLTAAHARAQQQPGLPGSMHAKYSSRLTKLFVGTAFFFLAILLGLSLTDYLSRGFKTYPGGAAGAGYGVRTEASEATRPAGAAAEH